RDRSIAVLQQADSGANSESDEGREQAPTSQPSEGIDAGDGESAESRPVSLDVNEEEIRNYIEFRDKLSDLLDEIEQDAQALHNERLRLRDVERQLQILGERMQDPEFKAAFELLVDYGPVELAKYMKRYIDEHGIDLEEESEQKPSARPSQPQVDPMAVYGYQVRLEQLLSDLSNRFGVSLSDRDKDRILTYAADSGILKPEALHPEYQGNPLEPAFFAVFGPQLASQLEVQKKQADINKAAVPAAQQAEAAKQPNPEREALEAAESFLKLSRSRISIPRR
ncbi:MAG: hypothetical protein QXZ09_09630, partial [Candidatus Methanomethylicaceae archaeon]